MTIYDDVNNEYFEWLYDLACKHRYSNHISYKKLLSYLHSKEFRYSMLMDKNRADDGLDLRYRYVYECDLMPGTEMRIDGPCSVLEMMMALAIKCEELMDDPCIGDRTRQWFWGMITNMGLGPMDDSRFDKSYVVDIVERFLDRDYEPDGCGGLFTVRDCNCDLRTVEIWHQLCWYLDTIT